MRGEDDAVPRLQLFEQRVADSLGQTALDLALDLLHVHGSPHVVNADDTGDPHLAGQRVDLDFDGLRRIAVAIVRDAGPVVVREHRRRRRAELDGRLDPLVVAGAVLLERLRGGVVHRSPGHQRQSRCRGAAGVRRLGRVVGDHLDAVERQPEHLGGDLAQRQVRALADIGRADADDRVLHFAAAPDLDRRRGLLGKAEGVAKVLDPAAMPTPRRIQVGSASGAPARRQTAEPGLRPPRRSAPAPAERSLRAAAAAGSARCCPRDRCSGAGARSGPCRSRERGG